jgi:hypothetical protein
MNSKRIERAIKRSYAAARSALAVGRDCKTTGDIIGYRAALETVAECRKLNAQRREALRLGHTI